jgi:phage gp29-like protein
VTGWGQAGTAALPPNKFIAHFHKAKSGLPIRGGLARAASWAWMFKTFSLKDWVIFCEVYGQPLRLGKYGPGASPADKETLFQAVSNIASDCAAIIPDSMAIEFIMANGAGGQAGGGGQLYRELCDWLDWQVSKAVLGQTTTTDAISGGHAVAREHRQVQQTIMRADARCVAGTLNRQLIPPLVAFNLGPLERYPRLKIGRTPARDLAARADALSKLVPVGLEVQMSEVRDMLGLADPQPGAAVLSAPATRLALARRDAREARALGAAIAQMDGPPPRVCAAAAPPSGPPRRHRSGPRVVTRKRVRA